MISYALSSLFIAIIWVNHHHLLCFVKHASSSLLWLNFAHLFPVSLIPFATAWMADSRLAPVAVAAYAAIFVWVNLAYLAFEQKVIRQADADDSPPMVKQTARMRSFASVLVFAIAIPVANFLPWLAFSLICSALLLYLRPEVPGSRRT